MSHKPKLALFARGDVVSKTRSMRSTSRKKRGWWGEGERRKEERHSTPKCRNSGSKGEKEKRGNALRARPNRETIVSQYCRIGDRSHRSFRWRRNFGKRRISRLPVTLSMISSIFRDSSGGSKEIIKIIYPFVH